MDKSLSKDYITQHTFTPEVHKTPVSPNRASEYTPKVRVIADYVM